MSKQGYLIKHDRKEGPSVVFVVLLEGELKYYDRPDGKLLGMQKLSGHKVNVKAQRRPDGIPNSFYIETRQVKIKDRSYTLGSKIVTELSATTSEERQSWGSTVFSWQRYYWRDLDEADELEKDLSLLQGILKTHLATSRTPVLRRMSQPFRRNSTKTDPTDEKKEIQSRVTISLPHKALQPVVNA